MNQLPIRDIDVISTDTATELTAPEIETVDEYLALIISDQERNTNNIIATGNILFKNASELKTNRATRGIEVEDVTLLDSNINIIRISNNTQVATKFKNILSNENIDAVDVIDNVDLGREVSQLLAEDKLNTLKIMMAIKRKDNKLFRKLLYTMHINDLNRKVTTFTGGAGAANYNITEINQFKTFCQNEMGISNVDFDKIVNVDLVAGDDFTRLWKENNTPLTYSLTIERMDYAEELLGAEKVDPRIENFYNFNGLTMLYYGINANEHNILAGRDPLSDAEVQKKGKSCQNILKSLDRYFTTAEYKNVVNGVDNNGRTTLTRLFIGGQPHKGFDPFIQDSFVRGLSEKIPTSIPVGTPANMNPFWLELDGSAARIQSALGYFSRVMRPKTILILKSNQSSFLYDYATKKNTDQIATVFTNFANSNNLTSTDVSLLLGSNGTSAPLHRAFLSDRFGPGVSNKAIEIVKIMQAFNIQKSSVPPRIGQNIDMFIATQIGHVGVGSAKGAQMVLARDLLNTLV